MIDTEGNIIPPDPVITIPSGDWKIVEAIHKHYADNKALCRVNELDNDRNILDKDSSDNVNRLAEQEYAIVEALAELLDARCPKCVSMSSKNGRDMTASDIINGCCFFCKTPIVRGE